MGLTSLFLFTLLGGLGAGTFVAETFLQKKRNASKPWLVPLIGVVTFAVGMIAATFHVSHINRIFAAQLNFGAGMVAEVAIAGCFFVLVLIDLIRSACKKKSPYSFRVITAIVGVISIITMGVAYLDVYGVAVWTNAPATLLTFIGGNLAIGVTLLFFISPALYAQKVAQAYHLAVQVVLALGLVVQSISFSAAELNSGMLIGAIILAPLVGIVLSFFAGKTSNKALPAIIFVCVFVGVALARWAFYAACTLI